MPSSGPQSRSEQGLVITQVCSGVLRCAPVCSGVLRAAQGSWGAALVRSKRLREGLRRLNEDLGDFMLLSRRPEEW